MGLRWLRHSPSSDTLEGSQRGPAEPKIRGKLHGGLETGQREVGRERPSLGGEAKGLESFAEAPGQTRQNAGRVVDAEPQNPSPASAGEGTKLRQ